MIAKNRFTPRHYTIAGLLTAAFVLLGVAFFVFQTESAQSLPSREQREQQAPRLLDASVVNFLSRSRNIDAAAYMPIVEKNLFSPQRQPWASPLPEDAQALSPSPTPFSPRAADIRLYGTHVTDQDRIGLFYFPDLGGKNKHRLLRESEFVRHGENEEGAHVYEVVRIERDRAALQDVAGRLLEIGLYDHQRVAARVDGRLPATRQGPTIITSLPAQSRDSSAPRHDLAPSDASPAREENSTNRQESLVSDTEQSEPPPLIPIQNHEEMEQLVEDGKMRKIMTPFGPIYRPITQHSP